MITLAIPWEVRPEFVRGFSEFKACHKIGYDGIQCQSSTLQGH